MKNKKEMVKKEVRKTDLKLRLKAYFIIVNLVLGIIAFSCLVSATIPSGTIGMGRETGHPTAKKDTPSNSPDPAGIAAVTSAPAVDAVSKVTTTKIAEGTSVLYKTQEGVQMIGTISKAGDTYTAVSNVGGKTVETAGLKMADLSVAKNIPLKGVSKIGDLEIQSLSQTTGGNLYATGADGVTKEVSAEAVKKAGIDTSGAATSSASVDILGFLGDNVLSNFAMIGMMAGVGYLIGSFIGDNADVSLAAAMAAGTFVTEMIAGSYGQTGLLGGLSTSLFGEGASLSFLAPFALPIGIGVGAIIFILMYTKQELEVVQFNCMPYEPPIGGQDCEKCNTENNLGESLCSEYRCKSLGQACQLLNPGTSEEKCAWVNPRDVTSPKIKMVEVSDGHKFNPDNKVRPPAVGVVITQKNKDCIKAFTPLGFTIATDEPAQCKVDYNLTAGYDEMNYFVGGTNLLDYNHTERLSLPGPDVINAIAPELKNDGTYTLYIRCRDANGNFNQDLFSVRFCVEKGPDTTPPKIEGYNVPSESPVQYNRTDFNLEVYINEPAECKWSREKRDYNVMENNMSCTNQVWEMNSNLVYTCRTTLTGIQDRKENKYYIRCKDQPRANESNRNTNEASEYIIVGTQPLNILDIQPNATILGSTNVIPVFLRVKTDNGYKNGESVCYYSTTGNEADYIAFAENIGQEHSQRQDLAGGSYKYYVKCLDLGGNADYDSVSFSVLADRIAPIVVRVYNEGSRLKIITNEKTVCSYSTSNCNFNIEDGIQMEGASQEIHSAEWNTANNYYIRCKDEYDNQPSPNSCSIIAKPFELVKKTE